MNDELKKLEHALQQATAADGPGPGLQHSGVSLDAETASLREGWLLLGQLIEAAQPEPDEPLKLPQLPLVTRRSTHPHGTGAMVAVLAASLLVGVSLVWSLLGTSLTGRGDSDRLAVDSRHPEPVLTADDLQWDDPLDEQIAQAGENLTRAQQVWYDLDDALASVAYGMEQIEEEIEDNTL